MYWMQSSGRKKLPLSSTFSEAQIGSNDDTWRSHALSVTLYLEKTWETVCLFGQGETSSIIYTHSRFVSQNLFITWKLCKTAKFNSTKALSFHNVVLLFVFNPIFFATICFQNFQKYMAWLRDQRKFIQNDLQLVRTFLGIFDSAWLASRQTSVRSPMPNAVNLLWMSSRTMEYTNVRYSARSCNLGWVPDANFCY